jgi:hypothetical protein
MAGPAEGNAPNGVMKRSKNGSSVLHFFRYPGFCEPNVKKLNLNIKKALPIVDSIDTEFCFNIQLSGAEALSEQDGEVGQAPKSSEG